MNILLVGSGGREHALSWQLAQSPSCAKLYAAPGNPGIEVYAECVPIAADDVDGLVAFVRTHAIDFVVVGPEGPLVAGLGDRLRAIDIPVFGPSAAAAQLEGSKGFTKDLCARAAIPTAGYVRCTSADAALAALADFAIPVVIKADGLAAGKGVIIAETRAEAEAAIADMFAGAFGGAGAEVVIEEFMTGEEASFFALSDGTNVIAFGSAQDHKRVGDGDTGPNTGGMGAYSPAPVLTKELEAEVMDRIIRPTVAALAAEGTPYVGVLFAGLMLTSEGPKLIEYNCRFGDPECQVLMMRLTGDFAALLHAAATGRLADVPAPTFTGGYALTVVMAANGYPGTPEKGGAIRNIAAAEAGGVRVFHAGTARADGAIVAAGGRVLNVTATGKSVTEAQARTYAAVDKLDFPSGFCRRDIGWREVNREAR
ncbi:MAG: phosphoribosylamine--glycine ligase [Sphingopyxis sp.]|uniref:Phosphoribosylamine--glycine ligase n=1 Tax=Sphingopyxis terrae subsp. terrae NBRC 15098 TaxID=1219058 RepID=A0A142VYV3_9SPHN|nr:MULTISPECIES: phosphoribosylamine--glycine ligase [Sphingopyxis]AMU94990.1 phosphoribosylamine--glycine ligase [Sphingopyxis terrae subsp. terrae NBRC 15098]QXF13431.1 phosphoribosylamine--glycine ligase [Sphingopyxis terrae subsp. terrae]